LNPLALLYRLAGWLRCRRDGNVGRCGEELAHRYLRARGYTIVARNWRPPQGGGELDLIAWDKAAREKAILVFIEVKSRLSGEWSAPERDIDAEKLVSLRRAARDYVRRAAAEEAEARFDVITVTGDRIEHFQEAFPLFAPRQTQSL
jgi:putative endonuclease